MRRKRRRRCRCTPIRDQCSFQFDPIGKNKFDSTSCDIAKSFLAKAGVSYKRIDAPSGAVAEIRSGRPR
jgi:hypothetical protein